MFELGFLAVLVALAGFARPRWSSVLIALLPTALAGLWLSMNTDAASSGQEELSFDVMMTAGVCAAYMAISAVGIIAGRLAGEHRARRTLL